MPLAERLGHTVWSGGDYDDITLPARTGDVDAYEKFWRQWGERARGRQHSFWLSQSELILGVVYGMPAAYTLLVRAYAGDKESALAALRRKGAAAQAQAEGRSASSLLVP